MNGEELVRSALGAFNRGDRKAVETLLAPDFELVSPMSDMRGHPYQGREGAQQWVDDLRDIFSGLEMEVDEFVVIRDGRLLGLGSARIQGRTSGLDYAQPVALVIDLGKAQIRRVRLLFDHDEGRRQAAALD